MEHPSLTFCSYNIHGWADAELRPNKKRVVELLSNLPYDVCCLQEVVEDSYGEVPIEKSLGVFSVRGIAKMLEMGNMILSKPKILSSYTTPILQERILVVGEIEYPSLPERKLTVFATHLEHRFEDLRVRQLNQITKIMEVKGAPGPHVIIGDFNSLRISDYTEEYVQKITSMREKNSWDPPMNKVVEKMDELGYVDAYRLALFQELNNRSNLNWSEDQVLYQQSLNDPKYYRDNDFATCWAGTRIDYIWLSHSLMNHVDRVEYKKIDSNASDHFPVTCKVFFKKDIK